MTLKKIDGLNLVLHKITKIKTKTQKKQKQTANIKNKWSMRVEKE